MKYQVLTSAQADLRQIEDWIIYEPSTPLIIQRVISARTDIHKLLGDPQEPL